MRINPEYAPLVTLPYEYLNNLKPAKGYMEIKKYGKQVIKWIETNCKFTEGEWEGRPFKLLEWQKLVLMKFYSFVKKDTDLDGKRCYTRQFRTLFINVPKKAGKTQLAAALMLYHLCPGGEGEPTPQIFSMAVNLEQSSYIYKDARRMIELNEPYFVEEQKLDVRSGNKILSKGNNGTFQSLTSTGAGKQGLRPSLVICDELHEYKNLRVFDSITGSQASTSRRQPIRLLVSTAGFDETGITKFYKKKTLDKMNTKGTQDPDELFLGVVFAAKEFNFKTAEKLAKIVHPGYRCYKTGKLLQQIREVTIKEALAGARMNQRKQEEFMAYSLNIELEKGKVETFIPMESWTKCFITADGDRLRATQNQIDAFHQVFKENPTVAGFDFGLKSDFSALVELAYNPKNKYFYVRPTIWVTQPEIKRLEQANIPILEWRKKGFFEPDLIDTFQPRNLSRYLHRKLDGTNIVRLGYDPYFVGKQMERFAAEPQTKFDCAPIKSTYGGMTEACDFFIRYLLATQIRMLRNDLFNYCARNTYTKKNEQGKVILDKRDNLRKIDPIVAMIYAFDTYLKIEPKAQAKVSELGTPNRLLKEPMFKDKRRRIHKLWQ